MNTESQILNVPIEDIIPNRFQPRLNFDENSLQELASSIKEHGIIQPLVLRRLNDKYEIIAGERRYKAAKMAGLMSVPAIITTLDDKTSAEVAIVENVQRKDLSSIEEAKSYKALLDKGYLTQEELAKKMGLSQSAISNKLRLLSLSQNVQDALMQNKISERHARSLLQLSSFQEQEEWLKKIIDERLTVKDLDNKIKMRNNSSNSNSEKNNVISEPEMLTDLTEVNNDLNVEDNVPIIEEPSKENNIDETNNNNEINEESKENIINSTPIFKENKSKPMPNKFFNFLEDEEANMSTEEEPEEEIELLDFIVPETQPKKYDDVTEKVNNLIKELNNNYKASLDIVSEDNKNKYIITIE